MNTDNLPAYDKPLSDYKRHDVVNHSNKEYARRNPDGFFPDPKEADEVLKGATAFFCVRAETGEIAAQYKDVLQNHIRLSS